MRQSGNLDLEAVEMLVRSAMHQAGASALTELLRFPVPAQRAVACPCGQQALYREQRSKRVLTAVGTVEVSRPYYLCPHCHEGQFPGDQELDLVHTEFSPGVRRMQALVGQDGSFDHGREQMRLLAGLEVTTKSVHRVPESTWSNVCALMLGIGVGSAGIKTALSMAKKPLLPTAGVTAPLACTTTLP